MNGRTPQQQAADFMAANDASLVVQGSVIGEGGEGAHYTLADRSHHRLGRDAHLIASGAGYPKWKLA